MKAELEEIRKRHESAEKHHKQLFSAIPHEFNLGTPAHKDRSTLLQMVDDLQAENEKYRLGMQENCQLRKRIAELEAEKTCTWTKTIYNPYGEYDNWSTSCGEDFAITEEWHEKPTKYCSNCGGKTVEGKPEDKP